ncbi:hypothetical protein [Streptomyces microflavus]|uniref:MmyB family transcriptional regulator n=1 Tax=Streptomyces microflavus TaxID=1919 RepID=UPI003B222FA9
MWREALEGQTHPAYITDASWEVIVHNEAFARLFPGGQVPRNTMRWMLLDPSGAPCSPTGTPPGRPSSSPN